MKYLFASATLLLLAGAGCTQNIQSQDSQSEINDQYAVDTNDAIVVSPIEEEEASLSPSTTSESLSTTTQPMAFATLAGQTDLASEYSSAILHTSLGDITVSFFADASPKTVNNFLNLAKSGEYNGTKFHRVIKDFMIQGGDPLSKDDTKQGVWGTGGPSYRFEDEFNKEPLVRGSLAMANAGPGTNGSQFFIVTAPETPWLDGKHTNFGKVTAGMDVVEKIEAVQTGQSDRPMTPIVVESVELIK
jgi:cyclophilin family peptidyl-prolyl cis-trans isomerase